MASPSELGNSECRMYRRDASRLHNTPQKPTNPFTKQPVYQQTNIPMRPKRSARQYLAANNNTANELLAPKVFINKYATAVQKKNNQNPANGLDIYVYVYFASNADMSQAISALKYLCQGAGGYVAHGTHIEILCGNTGSSETNANPYFLQENFYNAIKELLATPPDDDDDNDDDDTGYRSDDSGNVPEKPAQKTKKSFLKAFYSENKLFCWIVAALVAYYVFSEKPNVNVQA